MLLAAAHRAAAGVLGRPWGAALYSVQIVVPPLGDSISDGAIAAVLKGAGDEVRENETIAQVETDKVTIDIKAPHDGTIVGIVVKEQDTVVPGQLVATLDDAAAKAKLIGGTPPASQPQPAAPAAAAADSSSSSSSSGASSSSTARRVPGIRFPPRRLPDGTRISTLPAAEATAILDQWRAAGAGAPPAAAAAPAAAAPAAARPPAAPSQGWAAPAAGAAGGDAVAPSKFATRATRLPRMPERRQLSDAEIEFIDLGGALP